MQDFSFTYTLEGASWALLQVRCGDKEFNYSVSYLYDSLNDLSKKTLKLLETDLKEQRVIFVDEPGELRLELKKKENSMLEIIGKSFDETYFDSDETALFQVDFTCEVSLKEFSEMVFQNMDAIYKDWGMKGYLEKWVNHEFPEMNYFQLKKLLYAGKNKRTAQGD